MAEVPEINIDLTALKGNKNYDIFSSLAQYLDPHMVFPLLSYLGDLHIYDAGAIARARLELARKTSMASYAVGVYQEIHGADAEIPEDLKAFEETVQTNWQRYMDAAAPLVNLIEDAEGNPSPALAELQAHHNLTLEHLEAEHGIGRETVEALYDAAKFRFDCGEYDAAAFYLGVYRDLVPPESDRGLKALWGRFAGHVLGMSWEEADKDRELLRGFISKTRMSDLEALQQRSWLLHWSLFVFANHPKGRDNLVEFFMHEPHMNAVTLNCPWLLRYVAAVVVANKKRQSYVRQLLRVIAAQQQTAAAAGGASGPAALQDPIVEFLECLLVRFDFDGAQAKLAECEAVIVTDFFLSYLTSPSEFMEAARHFIFETYCRLHSTIDLRVLAAKLHMPEDEAEKWVVELIRSAALDAKIDAVGRQVIMTVPAPSVYQAVIDKTRELSVRTRVLADSIDSHVAGEGGGAPAPVAAGGGGGGGGGRRERY